MKTSPIKRAVGTAVLLASALAASAINVTYRVDMTAQIALGAFNTNTDTVFVSGDFSTPDWQSTLADGSTNFILTPSVGNPNIYEGTFNCDVVSPTFENHQFVKNPNGDFSALAWETAVGNRFFETPTTDTNLPAVYWNNVPPGSSIVTPVTFQVDMGVQMCLGNFNPGAGDIVLVAGDFDWSATTAPMLSQTSGNVWAATVNVTNIVGTTVNFKFVLIPFSGGTTWEGNVGPGGPQGNRQFVFPAASTNLPVVFFNNVTNCGSIPVTFEVNMVVSDALGTFTPGADTVYVNGDWNWSGSANLLTQSLTNAELYSGTVNLALAPGNTINYKYTINGGVIWENNNVGPGGGQNRQFVMPTTATNLPGDYFNNLSNLGTLSISNSAPAQATLQWTGGTRIKLQDSANLSAGWTDVANTLGSNSATVNMTGSKTYRLYGP